MDDLYQIKKKIFTGEIFDEETIDQLVALCENQNFQVSPFYVWDLLRQMDRKCKVYMKNKRILTQKPNDGVAGFVIYTFGKKNEDEGKGPSIKDVGIFFGFFDRGGYRTILYS